MLVAIACGLISVFVLGYILEIITYRRYSKRHDTECLKLDWVYHFKRYSISLPPAHLSTYYNKTHDVDYKCLGLFATLDDPYVLQIAEDFDLLFTGKSDRFKARCLLAMIQQNIEYKTSIDRFGVWEHWCFPVRTLSTKSGDCADCSIAYASIASCIGLDVKIIRYERHVMCMFYPTEWGNPEYLEMESYLPFPTLVHEPPLQIANPGFPPKVFIDELYEV